MERWGLVKWLNVENGGQGGKLLRQLFFLFLNMLSIIVAAMLFSYLLSYFAYLQGKHLCIVVLVVIVGIGMALVPLVSNIFK